MRVRDCKAALDRKGRTRAPLLHRSNKEESALPLLSFQKVCFKVNLRGFQIKMSFQSNSSPLFYWSRKPEACCASPECLQYSSSLLQESRFRCNNCWADQRTNCIRFYPLSYCKVQSFSSKGLKGFGSFANFLGLKVVNLLNFWWCFWNFLKYLSLSWEKAFWKVVFGDKKSLTSIWKRLWAESRRTYLTPHGSAGLSLLRAKNICRGKVSEPGVGGFRSAS